MRKVKVKKGEVWESPLGSQREVLEVTDRGGAIAEDNEGNKYYWSPENVNNLTFFRLISKGATIHAHMHCAPSFPWGFPSPAFRHFTAPSLERAGEFDEPEVHFHTQFGPPYNCRCIPKPVVSGRTSRCVDCGKVYGINMREPAYLRKYCAVCLWWHAWEEPIEKIDSVKVGQVWTGVRDGYRRKIVGISRSEKGVHAINTIRLDSENANDSRWPRKQAENWILGELVEDVNVVPNDGTCKLCHKHFRIPHSYPIYLAICPECEAEAKDKMPKPKKLKPFQIWESKSGQKREIVSIEPDEMPKTRCIYSNGTVDTDLFHWYGEWDDISHIFHILIQDVPDVATI